MIYLCIRISRSILYTHHCFDDNNNNKDLFAWFIFTMAFCAIEKKTIKMNKNVKIYQYITVKT